MTNEETRLDVLVRFVESRGGQIVIIALLMVVGMIAFLLTKTDAAREFVKAFGTALLVKLADK